MTKPDRLLVIGGSAGSLQVILEALPGVRKSIDFPVLIILHRKADNRSVLQEVLASKTKIKVKEADDKETLQKGVIYVAPADYHILIEKDHSFALDFSEKVHYTRPSIDVTLMNAAEIYGENICAFILSGANNDGAEGALRILQKGGKVWIQDPETAEIPVMPLAAYTLTKAPLFSPQQFAEQINKF